MKQMYYKVEPIINNKLNILFLKKQKSQMNYNKKKLKIQICKLLIKQLKIIIKKLKNNLMIFNRNKPIKKQ